jgi:hypothetical protein
MLTEGKIMLAFTGASTHVRRWSIKFGLAYAKTLRKTHPRAFKMYFASKERSAA